MADQTATLSEGSSLLLDIIRFSAALAVVVAHLSRPEFAVVLTRDLQFVGDFAVPVFFVLSGFVIRFVTVSREHTLRVYLIDRASRIYSVALPAMVLTLAVAGICLICNRTYFQQEIAPVSHHALLRVALNLTFLSQIWGFNTVQFADSPFWSLSYECLFYLAYGFLFYLRGAPRTLALILWAAVAGPPILLLFPLWMLGCLIYDAYQAIRKSPLAGVLCRLTLAYAVAALALASLGQSALLLALVRLDRVIARLPNPLALIHQHSIRATMLAVANGTVAAVAMFLLLLLSDGVPLSRDHGLARRFRRLADGTFVIYLMHYPLMMLARSSGLLRPNAALRDTLTVTAIVLVLIALAAPLDAFKSQLRRMLGQIKPAFRKSTTDAVHALR
jgi:peptidoglycan/LPS O-acetylase OafA/YrhL